MRILFLSQYFQPEPGFFVGLPFAKALARQGHDVEVLTGFPHYPGGKVYPGYRIKPLQREDLEGVPVRRVALYPSHSTSSFGRILCYGTFGLSASMIGPWIVKRADVAHVSQGPITIGWPAWILKLVRRIPFVLHIQDLWPDSPASTGMFNSSFGLKMITAACDFVYKRAGKIVVIAPGVKRRLVERGVPDQKIDVIYNWCDENAIHPMPPSEDEKKRLGFGGYFNVVYAGNIGRAQNLETVLEAAEVIKEKYPHVRFNFLGAGLDEDRLKQLSERRRLFNVRFLGRRPPSEVAPVLSAADALLVHLKKDPLFEITIPSKTQAYLAMGKPVLMGVSGDAAELVTRSGAGLCFPPGDSVRLAAAVGSLLSLSPNQLAQMGQAGRSFYESKLSFQAALARFESVFHEAMTG